jgi:hypothetical protein
MEVLSAILSYAIDKRTIAQLPHRKLRPRIQRVDGRGVYGRNELVVEPVCSGCKPNENCGQDGGNLGVFTDIQYIQHHSCTDHIVYNNACSLGSICKKSNL